MRALVVYESMFGNTQKIAEEVGRGLIGGMPVSVVEVGSAPARLPDDVTLLVVGGPTHAFGMSRVSTRKSAADQASEGELVSRGQGVREWLDALQITMPLAAAAFDTKIRVRYMPGSAAKGVHKILRKRHLRMISPPENFIVTGTKGPLEAGELERAREWGQTLAAAALRTQPA